MKCATITKSFPSSSLYHEQHVLKSDAPLEAFTTAKAEQRAIFAYKSINNLFTQPIQL